ncbi:MAG: hypothetical protein MI923_30490 [Phycisphaerales bacterium]|nr:hypothetical protein [Phycisphaerales bacterium]
MSGGHSIASVIGRLDHTVFGIRLSPMTCGSYRGSLRKTLWSQGSLSRIRLFWVFERFLLYGLDDVRRSA